LYRTTVSSDGGTYQLIIQDVKDRALVYINEKFQVFQRAFLDITAIVKMMLVNLLIEFLREWLIETVKIV
jgi:hypothetical protein